MTHRTAYHSYRSAGWRGLVCEAWRGRLDGADPLRLLTDRPHEVVRDRPAARTLRARSGDNLLYLKHVTSLKDREGGWLASLKWRVGPSRVLRTLRVSRRLAEEGFHVPPVLLAVRRRAGGRVEDLLITESVPGKLLALALRDAADDARRAALLEMAGRRIAALHRRRFIHGDLLPANLIVTPDHTDLILLDNDRTRRWPVPPPVGPRLRNLIQMIHRMPIRYPWRVIDRFLDSYRAAYGTPSTVFRRHRLHVLRTARRRCERFRAGHPEFGGLLR